MLVEENFLKVSLFDRIFALLATPHCCFLLRTCKPDCRYFTHLNFEALLWKERLPKSHLLTCWMDKLRMRSLQTDSQSLTPALLTSHDLTRFFYGSDSSSNKGVVVIIPISWSCWDSQVNMRGLEQCLASSVSHALLLLLEVNFHWENLSRSQWSLILLSSLGSILWETKTSRVSLSLHTTVSI